VHLSCHSSQVPKASEDACVLFERYSQNGRFGL
jgi:hypothetical protein